MYHITEGHKSRYGFTLIELLVVVAIISVLVSLLMPALGRARKNSQGLLCMSNLKQTSTALNFYLNDNNEVYPLGYTTTGGWSTYLTQYTKTQYAVFHYYDTPGIDYMGYVMSTGLCPLHFNHPIRSAVVSADYLYNYWILGYTPYNRYPLHLSAITDTTRSFLLADGTDLLTGNASCFVDGLSYLTDKGTIGLLHGNDDSINMLFVDGHIELRQSPKDTRKIATHKESTYTVLYE
jgi:prepilin-type N-terminal cleavage/methylation domain-containing protein/prepilin-type processing-associated H-X9-DG protein